MSSPSVAQVSRHHNLACVVDVVPAHPRLNSSVPHLQNQFIHLTAILFSIIDHSLKIFYTDLS